MNNFAGRLRRRARAGFWCTVGAAFAAAALSACATSGSMLEAGRQAERLEDWDRAVVEYTAAAKANPQHQETRLALERAKLRATQVHVANGRRFASAGKLDEALVEYQIASQLSPASTEIDDALRNLRGALRTRVAVTHRRQDAAAVPHRAHARPAARGPRSAGGRQAPRLAGVPRGQHPGHLHGDRALRRRQRRLRSRLPRRDAQHRLAQCHAGAGPRLGLRRHPQFLPHHRAAHAGDRARHAGQAPRVRGGGRPHLLPVECRPEGDRRPAPHRDRRAEDLVGRRHERHRAQGHARTGRGGRQAHRRHRQGPPGGDDRSRRARSGPRAPEGIRPADCLPGLGRHRRRGKHQPAGAHAARPADADLRRRLSDDVPRAVLPAAQDGRQRPHAGQSAASDRRGHCGPGEVRRAGAGAEHHVPADRDGRREPAAGHVVHVREHRRQHRHHAADASQRRGVAGAQGGSQRDLRRRLRRPADVRQPIGQHDHPPARRRDERAGGPDPRRGADDAVGHSRPERHPGHRPALRPQFHRSARSRTSSSRSRRTSCACWT